MTPAEIYDLITKLAAPKSPDLSVSANDPEFAKFEDAMQVYCDRLADLRHELYESIPESEPAWVSGCAYQAWMGAKHDADDWCEDVRRSRRARGYPHARAGMF